MSATDTEILNGLLNLFREENYSGDFRLILDYDNYQDGARIFDGDGNLLGECYTLFDDPPEASDAEYSIGLQFKAAIQQAMQKQKTQIAAETKAKESRLASEPWSLDDSTEQTFNEEN